MNKILAAALALSLLGGAASAQPWDGRDHRGGRQEQRHDQRGPDQRRSEQQRGPEQRGPQQRGPEQRGPDRRAEDRRGDERRNLERRAPERRDYGQGYERRDYGGDYRNDYRGDYRRDGRGGGWEQRRWTRGQHLPGGYRAYVVDDYRRYNLRRPPRGYEWVRMNDDYVLAAVATGLIMDVIAGRY